MRRAFLVITLLALAIPGEAQAHRLNWRPVRAVALYWVETGADREPQTVAAGIASRCWREGNHVVGCPIFMRIDHTDESGNVRHLRCTGTVIARADPYTDDVEWELPDLPCEEIGPPPPPPPGFG